MPTALANTSASAAGAVAVTPSDSTALDFRALWVGGAGNVAVRTRNGQTVTFSGVAAGTVLPVQGDRVMSASTTATLILALS